MVACIAEPHIFDNVTAPADTTPTQAEAILNRGRVEKLLLIDAHGRLAGLITMRDIDNFTRHAQACRDARGRLRVGAAIGVMQLDRAERLVAAEVDVIVVDTAHGHSLNVLRTVNEVKKRFPKHAVIASLMVETLKKCGDDLTRDNVMRQAANYQKWKLPMAIPGIKVVAPSNAADAKGLLAAAIRDPDPVLFFEHVLLYNLSEDIPEGDYICALDQAEIVREGADVTILTYSRMRHHCLKAVQQLEAEGVDVELIDLISLKPFDMDTIARSIRKTHKVLIVEECMKTGGIGAELMALITEQCFDDLDARPVRLSSQDIPTPYNGTLENLTIIQPHQIVEAAKALKAGQV